MSVGVLPSRQMQTPMRGSVVVLRGNVYWDNVKYVIYGLWLSTFWHVSRRRRRWFYAGLQVREASCWTCLYLFQFSANLNDYDSSSKILQFKACVTVRAWKIIAGRQRLADVYCSQTAKERASCRKSECQGASGRTIQWAGCTVHSQTEYHHCEGSPDI